MGEREYSWSEAGMRSASQHGVSLAEVIEALYSSNQYENVVGATLLAVCGEAAPRRLITVLLRRVTAGVATYWIRDARPATAWERDEWYRRFGR